jgi:hypothetical protein
MEWIITPQDFAAHKKLIDLFFELYVHPENFPDANEREDPDVIKQRIETGSDNPHTHLVIVPNDDQTQVLGGGIVEFYPRSQCVLLTYLFVNPTLRRTGIARQVIQGDQGLRWGIGQFEQRYQKRVNVVLFETNNPLQTQHDSLSPAVRLKIFSNLGAKWIDISYQQPALDPSKQAVDNLLLCTFPALIDDDILLPHQYILNFIDEFYDSLEAPLPLKKAYLHSINTELQQLSRNYLNSQAIYLKELPKIEDPKLYFGRASVCFHLLVDETNNKPQGLKPTNTDSYCTVFHSFETDLFSYRYQYSQRPYFSKSFDSVAEPYVTIRFPACTEYTTEGRLETLYVLEESPTQPKNLRRGQEVSVRAFLNFSYFEESEIRIWHLVLTSLPQLNCTLTDETYTQSLLTEYDIIRLMKFFSGAQEWKQGDRSKSLEEVRFFMGKNAVQGQGFSLFELLHELSGVRYVHTPTLHEVISGIVQIDTDYGWFKGVQLETLRETHSSTVNSQNIKEIFRFLKAAHQQEVLSENALEDFYKTNRDAEYIFESFCGITLGIFDFTRMGYEEVIDTLIPRSATKTSFLSINRGVLSSFGRNDEMMATTWNTIGMSPYLIIPSAVLAHNTFVVNSAESKINEVIHKYEVKSTDHARAYLGYQAKGMKSIRNEILDLEKTRKEVEELINTDYLPNVFQYPTEQDLYAYGLNHRGIADKIANVSAKLGQVRSMIDERKNSLNDIYQFWVQLLLGVVSLFQIEGVFQSLAELMADSQGFIYINQYTYITYKALGWLMFAFPLVFFIWYILKIRPKTYES